MPEPDFASQVAALYAQPATSGDDAAFLAQVSSRIDRYRQRRRWVLASLGIAGAAVTVGAFVRLDAASLLRDQLAGAIELFAGLPSMPWFTSGIVIIALLVLPAFVRGVVDPK